MGALLVAITVLMLLPLIFRWPAVGIFGWYWLGFLNPHQIVYGTLGELPFAAAIAASTLIAWLISPEEKRIPVTPITIMIVLIGLCITWTSYNAIIDDAAWDKWDKSIKILLITLVSIAIMTNRERIHILVWVFVISLGFYGIKGGVFTILTGGEARVWGPPRSFIGDNNALAMALAMTLPFLRYLQMQSENKTIRWGLSAGMVLLLFSIIGSQSRGAFLSLTAMGIFLVLKSRSRLGLIFAAILVGSTAVWFVPDSWVERMESIQNYEEDDSAQSRFRAWRFSYELAKQRPFTGGGFNVYLDEQLYFSIIPEAHTAHNAHSIYFETMGQHGFLGFGLFMALIFLTWRQFSKIIRQARPHPHLRWAQDLAAMSQVSLVAYMIGGTFLNLAFFDLYFLVVSFAAMTANVLEKELQVHAEKPKLATASEREQRAHIRRRPAFSRAGLSSATDR